MHYYNPLTSSGQTGFDDHVNNIKASGLFNSQFLRRLTVDPTIHKQPSKPDHPHPAIGFSQSPHLKHPPLISPAAPLILFNKPYHVLSQFTPEGRWRGLRDFIALPGVYAAGRLDADSEGLLLLTSDGPLQARISDPRFKMLKAYWVR